jgi:hypothetical protein
MRVRSLRSALLGLLGVLVATLPAAAQAAATAPQLHGAHFHLINYIQEGTDIRAHLDIILFGRNVMAPSGFLPLPHEGAEACNT